MKLQDSQYSMVHHQCTTQYVMGNVPTLSRGSSLTVISPSLCVSFLASGETLRFFLSGVLDLDFLDS